MRDAPVAAATTRRATTSGRRSTAPPLRCMVEQTASSRLLSHRNLVIARRRKEKRALGVGRLLLFVRASAWEALGMRARRTRCRGGARGDRGMRSTCWPGRVAIHPARTSRRWACGPSCPPRSGRRRHERRLAGRSRLRPEPILTRLLPIHLDLRTVTGEAFSAGDGRYLSIIISLSMRAEEVIYAVRGSHRAGGPAPTP